MFNTCLLLPQKRHWEHIVTTPHGYEVKLLIIECLLNHSSMERSYEFLQTYTMFVEDLLPSKDVQLEVSFSDFARIQLLAKATQSDLMLLLENISQAHIDYVWRVVHID